MARADARSAVLVFARRDGQPMDRSVVTKAFGSALTRHGFPSVRLHSLRHAAAVSMLDVMGGDIRAVSAVLGHASIVTTVSIYGQEADDARRRAAEAMDRAMERRAK